MPCQAIIRAFIIRKKLKQVRKQYEDIFSDIETDVCPDGKTCSIQWREPAMSKPCVLPKSYKTHAVAVKEVRSGSPNESHQQPRPDSTPSQDTDYQVHGTGNQTIDIESHTNAGVKGQDGTPQQEHDNDSNLKDFNDRDLAHNAEDQQASSMQNHQNENQKANPDSRELVLETLPCDQEDLQLAGDVGRMETGFPSPIDNYTSDFESYTTTTASQASDSIAEKSDSEGLIADNGTSPTAQSSIEETVSTITEVTENVHLKQTCLIDQKIPVASETDITEGDLRTVNHILIRKSVDDVSLTDSKAGGAEDTIRPGSELESNSTGSLTDSERFKTGFGTEVLHAPLDSQALKTDNGTKDSIRNDVTGDVHSRVPNGATAGEKLTDLSDRESVTDTTLSLSHLSHVTDNNQRDVKMQDKDGDEREDVGNGLSLGEEEGGEKCKSVISGRTGGELESSIVADMTSVWSNENSFTDLTDYPSDLEELKQMRNTTALELLWVQQAISSRKNYLRLKSNMESSQ
ncbi:uncharacterized protein LOC117301013 [Asterias rubens]|uniref:uncharacterized protein LOC117301013 n=1 Tax=Asterias rubens TaxID=7604 RepID=UPI001455062E|nr:uncharacterized protein LOC117301013 [Asterias rubens]